MYNETSGASTKGVAVNEQPPQHIMVMTAKKCGEVAAFRAQAPWDEQREGKTVTQSELAPEQTNEAPALATNASENKITAQQRARIATLGRQRGRLKLHDWDSPHDLRRRGKQPSGRGHQACAGDGVQGTTRVDAAARPTLETCKPRPAGRRTNDWRFHKRHHR